MTATPYNHHTALALCTDMMLRAYAPYSHFFVGAVIYADNGQYYGGCNVENAAYPQGSCAESGAICHMIINGAKHIHAVWVMGDGENLVTPCGGCRQRMREFAVSLDIPIFVCSPDKGVRLQTTLNDLLPYSFGPNNLGQ